MKDKTGFPQLETERLLLRMLTYDDIDTIFPVFSSEEVLRYITAHPVKNADDVKGLIDWGNGLLGKKMGTMWGIFSKKGGSFIGEVNYISRKDNNFAQAVHRGEIGYEMDPRYWGKGFMSEALQRVILHIFSDTGIDRIEAMIHPENARSHNVVARLGFHKEGTLRSYEIWEGEHRDMVLYSLLKTEWGKGT